LRLCLLDSICSNLIDKALELPTFCWCQPHSRSIKLYGVLHWGSVTGELADVDVFIVRLGIYLPTQSSSTTRGFVTYCNTYPTVAKVVHGLILNLKAFIHNVVTIVVHYITSLASIATMYRFSSPFLNKILVKDDLGKFMCLIWNWSVWRTYIQEE